MKKHVMNRWLSLGLCLVMAAGLAGCGGSASAPVGGSRTGGGAPGVNDVLEAGIAAAGSSSASESVGSPAESGQAPAVSAENEETGLLAETENVGTGDEYAVVDNSTDSGVSDAEDIETGRGQSPAAGAGTADQTAGTAGAGTADSAAGTADSGTAAGVSGGSSGTSNGIDVDLTTLSSTMVYSEVYNMMVAPQEYVGKTVKMDGLYSGFYDDTTKKYYFACIVQDATACCSQGIEFELTDDYKFPDDYPSDGDFITVTGVFDIYQEGEFKYCTLRNAKLL